MGLPITWLVECKSWKSRIPKEKVLTLRQIVTDLGADRGFLMNERGHQSGALQAARQANVHLTSLADLTETCRYDIAIAKLRCIYDRVQDCRERYWALSKAVRINYGLRGDMDPHAYSGDHVIKTVETCAINALLNGFPVIYDEVAIPLSLYASRSVDLGPESLVYNSPDELVTYLRDKLSDLELRLRVAEEDGQRSGD
jgi:hypothetical protein